MVRFLYPKKKQYYGLRATCVKRIRLGGEKIECRKIKHPHRTRDKADLRGRHVSVSKTYRIINEGVEMRKLFMVAALGALILALGAGPVFAGTAERSLSNGNNQTYKDFPETATGETNAYNWIKYDSYAKGRYFGNNGNLKWVVLMDKQIYSNTQANWRGPSPGSKYQMVDDQLYSKAIQYTINRLPINKPVNGDPYDYLTEDSNYGPLTKGMVELFQQRNGSSVDGVMGPNSYSVMAWTFY